MMLADISTFDHAVLQVIKKKMQLAAIDGQTLAWAIDGGARCTQLILNGKRPLTVKMLTRIATALDTTAFQIHKEAKALDNE